MGSPTYLTLIRHGESRSQEQGLLSGHDSCTGLSDKGRSQVAALRDRLMTTHELGPVDAVYTSILARSIETAAILQPAFEGATLAAECEWCEIHAGEAEGLRMDELAGRYPMVSDAHDAFARRIPGAETWAEFYVRVGARLHRVGQEHAGQRVVVVAHGGTVGASFVALGDLPVSRGTKVTHTTTNASLTQWRFQN